MKKLNPGFELSEGVNFNMLYDEGEYKRKTNEIKAAIDELLREDDEEAIDTLYRLLVRRNAPNKTTTQELKETLDKLNKNGH